MKTMKKVLLITALVCLAVSCSKSYDLQDQRTYDLKSRNMYEHNHSYGLGQERFVQISSIDLNVHYRIIGKGPVDMVFIPGWTNPLTVYTKQFDYFRDKARCIYIDLPGHGLSDAPEGIEYTQELMGDAIYDIIKKEGVKHFIGVGFSWGWKPLQMLEIKHPGMITQLVLLDVGVTRWPPMTEETREATYAAQMAWTEADKAVVATEPADYVEWAQYYTSFPSWLMANMYYHYMAEDVCQPYPWDIPIMGIWRTLGGGTTMRQYFPGVEIYRIGGNLHVIQWEQADLVNQLIDDFMADRPGEKY